MEITKEYLQQKIQEYKTNFERLRNDAIATQGAAQALELLLADLEKEDKPAQ